ncbi:response regulator transcription factor [Comamonas kerstersii]|uniref:DNA-binding response regulator n=1 Tax=Comamonas kerstersii TaxID=225992 RepID=A0A1V0BG68_9BURK|nr:response regulator transcription factor [Comamonas kerstersii]AQZ98851.1 DNA-binding response regulator [Comamonas kerstersii]KAB0587797.1 response regulator transcription factor [Comamonas kerstersii]
MSASIKILLADDHPALMLGLRSVALTNNTLSLIGTASDSTEVMNILEQHDCDVLVTDYIMPGGQYGDGISMITLLQRRFPHLRFVVLSMLDNPAILKTLMDAQIACILSKADDPNHIVPAIHAAYAYGSYYSPSVRQILESTAFSNHSRQGATALSQRETEVIRLFVAGLSINEIADRLHRSKQTISTQKNNAMRKLGLTRDADLYRYAMSTGLLTQTPATPQDPS